MKRIVFSGIVGHSRYPYSGSIGFSDGLPPASGAGIENLLERYDYTGNKGNMIHGEAPSRIFKCDRTQSCFLSLPALFHAGWSPEKINEELSSRFDLVVFSMANAIRHGFDTGGVLPEIFNKLEMDIVVLGLGMQDYMPPEMDRLHPNLARLLRVLDDKAKVIGVRGDKTEHWLKQAGLSNAIALGCPSMFVYPHNIMGLKNPDPKTIRTAVTGGYINARVSRSYLLAALFKDFKAHYVMQMEMFALKEYFSDSKSIYNEATGEVNKELLNIVLEKIHNKKLPFESYRWFQDPHAWRIFSSQADFYLGDRFHGGVAALQAGVPAIIIADDQRVREMTDFFDIPNISVKEAGKSNVRDLVKTHLSIERIHQLRGTYAKRFSRFREIMRENDIELTVSIDHNIDERTSIIEKTSKIPKQKILRRLVSKLKSA